MHRHAGGELGWIDDGLAFLENGGLGKRRMPGPFPMAGFATDGGLYKDCFQDQRRWRDNRRISEAMVFFPR